MKVSLRMRRGALGRTALEMAGLAGCTVEVVSRSERGVCVPHDRLLPGRLGAGPGATL